MNCLFIDLFVCLFVLPLIKYMGLFESPLVAFFHKFCLISDPENLNNNKKEEIAGGILWSWLRLCQYSLDSGGNTINK